MRLANAWCALGLAVIAGCGRAELYVPEDGAVTGDCTVTCLYHGWKFHLADGRWDENPRIRVATHEVRVVGDDIQVAVAPSD